MRESSQLSRPRWPAAATLWLVGALAVVEWLWLAWFLTVPLPNAAAVGGDLTRSDLLWQALPGLIPGQTWGESHLGAAVEDLSHVEHLPARLPILLAGALIAGAAVALGGLVLRALGIGQGWMRLERVAIAFALGAAGLGVLTLGFGRFGLLTPWSVRLGLAGVIGVGLYLGFRGERRGVKGSPPAPQEPNRGDRGRKRVVVEPSKRLTSGGDRARFWIGPLGLGLVVGPFLVLMLLGAMLPTIEFDALEYHLQGPKEHFLNGRIAFLPHNVYTSMPFGVEMLHLLGMHALNDWWAGALVGQVLVMLHAPATAILIARTATRLGSPRAGWIAAVAYLTAPWVYRLAVTPFVEGSLCLYHAGLIFVAVGGSEAARDQDPHVRSSVSDARWSVPTLLGLLAGGAMGCKYPALISAVLPFGVVAGVWAIRRRSWAIVLAYAAGVAILAGPWLVKNVVDTGNPVYPLAYGVFGGGRWDDARQAKWAAAHGPRPVTLKDLTKDALDVVGRSDWQSPLFLALAPLALLRAGSRRAGVVLWLYVGYLFATWWLLTHRVDRFWIPILPALAILAGLGADWARGRAWSTLLGLVLAVGVASNLVFVSTDLAGSTRWTDDLDVVRAETLAYLNPPMARLDETLPDGARVLVVGQAGTFPLRGEITYNTVFDPETIEALARDRSPAEVRRAFRDRGLTHVYVDWSEIDRYRRPGNYGYSDFVTPALFARLIADGVLEPLGRLGPAHELYRVR